MSKLGAALCNHFVLVLYIAAIAPFSRGPRPIPAPLTQESEILRCSPSIVIPRLSATVRIRLSPVEIEAINSSASEFYRPASTPQLLPDST
jgi:hypothetical protein